MKTGKLHSSVPYFLLVGLFGLVPVLNNKYPAGFFPDFSPWSVEVISSFAGIAAATIGFMRLWARLEKQTLAKALVLAAIGSRHAADHPSDNDVAAVGRIVSRLVRNVDGDLQEIKPDFSADSLRRLERFLPKLMEEIGSEEEAFIRVGVVGVYLGEVACRNFQWQWHFNTDPALRQFSYVASEIQRQGRSVDPYAWAADLMAGKGKVAEFMKEING